jgi:antitoxin MazE
MIVRAQKWGNSLALRIPGTFAKQLGLKPNAQIELTLTDDTLCAKPIRESFPTLEELLAKITPENRHGEYDWGAPEGREAW